MRVNIGTFVRWTRAHGTDLDTVCWGRITSKGVRSTGITIYYGVIVMGSSPRGGWWPGSEFTVTDPIETSTAWICGDIYAEFVLGKNVPGEVWAAIAHYELTR